MAKLTPEASPQIAEACRAGASEAAAAISRALGCEVKLTVGQPGTVDISSLPQWMGGPGLAVVLTTGGSGALVLVPEDSGLLPPWYSEPDATGQSRLTTLAQELGMVLLPEQFAPEDFKAAHVKSLHGAAARGGLVGGAALVPLQLESPTGQRSTAAFLWPATKPSAVLGAGAVKPKTESKPQPKTKPVPAARPAASPKIRAIDVDSLPSYARSLLRIEVPVIVTLAQKRQPLGRVIELGPGSIIQFDKSCEELLELDVGGRLVATGEAVKVGDKFGLRIKSVVLPEERFRPIKPQKDVTPNPIQNPKSKI